MRVHGLLWLYTNVINMGTLKHGDMKNPAKIHLPRYTDVYIYKIQAYLL